VCRSSGHLSKVWTQMAKATITLRFTEWIRLRKRDDCKALRRRHRSSSLRILSSTMITYIFLCLTWLMDLSTTAKELIHGICCFILIKNVNIMTAPAPCVWRSLWGWQIGHCFIQTVWNSDQFIPPKSIKYTFHAQPNKKEKQTTNRRIYAMKFCALSHWFRHNKYP